MFAISISGPVLNDFKLPYPATSNYNSTGPVFSIVIKNIYETHSDLDDDGVDDILRFLDPIKTSQGCNVCDVWHDLWPERIMDRDGNSGSAQSFLYSTRYQTDTVKMKCIESFHSKVPSLVGPPES